MLTDDEIHHWEECKSDQTVGGDIVNWETARFNITAGISQTVEDKEKYICFHKTSGKIYKTIKSKENFDGTVKYCNTIGADVATAEDAKSLKEINTIGASRSGEVSFYSITALRYHARRCADCGAADGSAACRRAGGAFPQALMAAL